MPSIEFDAEHHIYTLDGKVVPSVSQLIASDPSLNPWLDRVDPKLLAEKAELGTAVHDYLHLADSEDADGFEGFKYYREQWMECRRELLRTAGPGEWAELSEQRMGHPALKFAGTPDRVYWNMTKYGRLIVDIKTGSESKAHHLQTAGYAYLAAYRLDPSDPIIKDTKRCAVYLSADKPYKVVWHDDPTDYTAFMALLNLYKWKMNKGYIK